MRQNRAFTLIELLIVVAIIAILAAIAVPNFLEAQTRSRVSRAKADMRTLVTAVEVFRVDRNSYPPDGDDDSTYNFDSRAKLAVLTTPVAYLTALPADPFNTQPISSSDPMVLQTLQALFPGSPPHMYVYNTYGAQFAYTTPGGIDQPANNGNPDNFSLTSLGPNKAFDSVIGYPVVYDPTNGTLSAGDIVTQGGSRTPLSLQ